MRVLVVGAGGFSAEVGDLVVTLGHEIVAFLDPWVEPGAHRVFGVPVVGSADGLRFDAVTIGIGETAARRRIWERMREHHDFPVFVHPSAVVSERATLGAGTAVMQHCTVNAAAEVGENVILNVGCCVAHDCVVGAHCHIGPGVQMSGGSSVGEEGFCGTSSVLLPGIRLGERSTCGAGSVVIADVGPDVVVAGVPAKPLRSRGDEG